MANVWDTIKPFVGKFAPMLGAAVGGPFGAAAGAIISNVLGTKDASPESLATAIKTGTITGEQIVALKLAEQDFSLKMKELDINSVKDLEALAGKDRDSARNMQIQTKSWVPPALATLITLGFFGLLSFLLRREIPQGSKDVLNVMLGSLGSAWLSVVAFYFGTTANSQTKTEMIYKSTPIKE
jgi:hypothetical protein